MRSRLTRTAAGALALTIAGFTLAGCGDDSKGSGTTSSGATAETTVAESSAGATDTTVAAATEGAASSNAAVSADRNNILYTAVGAGNFLTLARLLGTAGLLDTVKDGGPFTVFAPTDEAFAKVPADTLAALAADKDKLTKVLLYHVVPGTLTSDKLAAGALKTAEGSTVQITLDGTTVKANDATVVAADVLASNGVIHVVDSVMLPPDL